jgi:hypothetical protein
LLNTAATAKDEVGSLIVQSVLENWNEAAKADVVEELLVDIYSCAVQQWGVSQDGLFNVS